MGITVKWNKEDAVMVELDSKYSNLTCGLCGDFNGIPVYNEFIDYGRKVGYIEFGNMHRVPNPTHTCKDPFENADEQNVVNKCEKFRSYCADLLKDEKWSSCSWVLNREPYIKACTKDICLRQPKDKDTDTSVLCATLSEYSRLCSHAGGTPPNWRTAKFCAVTCPYNMVHSESGSPCMDTCSHKNTNTLCEEHNIDGCFCPPGTVFDDISNMGCIPAEKCKCKHDRIYSTGEILRKDDGECICKKGEWICTSIPVPGLCAVEEGSHFTTFDGKEFTFNGDCNYVLSKDCKESKFNILGEIVPCFNQQTDTCLKSVVVLFNNDMKNPLIIKADGTVQHNADVLLPYMTADFTVFKPSSFHIMLQTTFGLQVQVQLVPLMQVYITVHQSFQGKTCGMCGNFNKMLLDDLKTPQGVVEGTAVSFANAWKALTNCPDRTERMDDPCSYSSNSEQYANHWCSKMQDKKSLFAKCHTTVNPDSYYKRCRYSSCNCEKSEDCLCAVFSSYARACAAKGIILEGWRKIVCEKYTKNCPTSQNYSYELQTCQRSCLSLASERQSCSLDFVPVDGCACPDGLYQDENGLCVPMEKCSCFQNGQQINPGKSVTIRDEHCVCRNGKLNCRSWKPQTLGCSSPKVFFNCSTSAPDEHGLECAKTCLQQKVDCFSVDCQSGCQCPSGLLDDGRGNCVKPDNCPCTHDGQFYAQGSQITTDCNKCTCQQGKWKCTHYKCPGICTIYGSGHYRTFDQHTFGFSGGCSYIAAQNTCGNKTGHFHVITENMPCGTTGTTCSKAVKILLGRTMLLLSGGTVTAADTGSGPEIKYIERSIGMYLVIDANIGLTVLWDRKTTVRIILQPQHMGDVCGLCGNFNGNAKDDFTTQGNLPTTNIREFVDSWKVLSNCPDAKPDFNPCSETSNRETWAKIQCSIIKDIKGPFKDCHNKVDQNPYYENCVKDSCACNTGGDCECFCTAVTAYAQACNEADVCVNWRTPEICPVYCDYYNYGTEDCTWHYSPCHTPCYKTCLNPNATCDNSLPNLEGFCEGWGDPHYNTFDGLYYSYQGNCTYILMEEIMPQYHLKIYIDSVYCDPVERVSCPRSIIVSYNKLVITLTNHNLLGGADLEAFVNNVKLRLPYFRKGVRVISSSLDLMLSIQQLGVNITFGATGFGINLPFQHFGDNTQGHCGTCNNNKADDCMIPGGILVDNCAVMADYWAASGVNSEICTPPTALPTAVGIRKSTSKPCQAHQDCNLLKSKLFEACHSHIPPKNFFLACQYDSCHMRNPALVCTSLQTYARACSQLGICIHWRNYTNLCKIECPADKVFNPCGPAEPPTCADIPEQNTITVSTEGCFCPKGTLLFNKNTDVCVKKCGCLDASRTPREFNEVFEYNCEECICNKDSKSVTCKPKKCSDVNPEICTEPGFVLVNVTNPSDPCCSKQVCNCDGSMCPPMNKKCPVGRDPVPKVPYGKCCPEIKCEPKKVCVHLNMEYMPGTNIPVTDCQECICTKDVDPETQLFKVKCGSVQCNEKCDPGYEYIKNNLNDCCGKCVQTHCTVNINGVNHTLKEGKTLPSTNQGCDRITCTKVNGQFIINKYTVQCPPFNISNCKPGTVQRSPDDCCPVCVDQIKGCQLQTIRSYIKHRDCQSEKKMDLTFCSGDCTSSSRYIQAGMSSCTCCQATQASNRTVNLGCVNGNIVTHTYIHVEKCACSRANCHREDVGQTLT